MSVEKVSVMAGETCRRDCQNMDKHKRYSNYIAGGRGEREGEGMHRKKNDRHLCVHSQK